MLEALVVALYLFLLSAFVWLVYNVGAIRRMLGYKAVDTDYGGFSLSDEHGGQHWDVDRIRQLLATEDADVLFVVGADDNQVLFYPGFDHIGRLSAPRGVMVERLASRTNNPFGKSPDELAKVLADLETYEPLMRRSATHEIDTSKRLDLVIDEILSLVKQPPAS